MELLERELKLEKIKKHDEIMIEPSIKHNIRVPKLPPFDEEKDGMDAYLNRLERYEESLKWPRKEWAVNLSVM